MEWEILVNFLVDLINLYFKIIPVDLLLKRIVFF